MHCADVDRLRSAFLNESLAPVQEQNMLDHLVTCAGCSQQVIAAAEETGQSSDFENVQAELKHYGESFNNRITATVTTAVVLKLPSAPVAESCWRYRLAISVAASIVLGASVLLADALLSRAPIVPPSKVVADDEKHPEFTATEQERITALVRALSSEEAEEREGAARELTAFGPRLLPKLKELAESHDPDVRALAGRIEKRIRFNATLAALEALAPSITKKMEVADPEERQKQIIEVMDTIKPWQAMPILVEMSKYLDTGPMLWGCLEALNLLAAPHVFLDTRGAGWAGGDESVAQRLGDFGILRFTDDARRACSAVRSTDQNESRPIRIILAKQLALADIGFYAEDSGPIVAATPKECVTYWRSWWARKSLLPEWQSEAEQPSAENIARWTGALASGDALSRAQAVRRVLDHWQLPVVRNLTARTGKHPDPHIQWLANSVAILGAARNEGRILFNYKDAQERMAVWIMNLDGSGQRPLLPQDLGRRPWGLDSIHGDVMLLRDCTMQALYHYRLGEVAPKLIEQANAYHTINAGTGRVIYHRSVRESGGPGGLKMFDLESARPMPMPEILAQDVGQFALSPNQKTVLFTRYSEGQKERMELWTCALATNASKKWMGLDESFKPFTPMGVTWSADGRWITGSSCKGRGDTFRSSIWIIDTTSKEIRVPSAGYRSCSKVTWAPHGARCAFIADKPNENTKQLVIFDPATQEKNEFPLPNGDDSCYVYAWIKKDLCIRGKDGYWLMDVDSVAAPRRITDSALYLMDQVKFGGKDWILSELESVGELGRQIVLWPPDCSNYVPLTVLPGGCRSPQLLLKAQDEKTGR